MEARYEKGEIRSFEEYTELLKEHGHDTARVIVIDRKNLFDKILDQAIARKKSKLIKRNLRDILKEYFDENGFETNILDSMAKIDGSGHLPLINSFFKQYFVSKNDKMNTLCIKGKKTVVNLSFARELRRSSLRKSMLNYMVPILISTTRNKEHMIITNIILHSSSLKRANSMPCLTLEI